VKTTSVVLQVLSSEYRVTDALAWSVNGGQTTFTFTAPSNLAEGTVDVWLKSATDVYGNAMANTEDTKAVHFIDLTGPVASVGSEFPARNASTSNTQTEVRFSVADALSGLDRNAATVTLQYKRGGGPVTETLGIGGTTHPTRTRASPAGGLMEVRPRRRREPLLRDGSVTVTLTVGKDVAGNALRTPSPGSSPSTPPAPGDATSTPPARSANRQHEIRCRLESVGSEISTTSVQLKVNATTYYIPARCSPTTRRPNSSPSTVAGGSSTRTAR
jgi:hypothetical protein